MINHPIQTTLVSVATILGIGVGGVLIKNAIYADPLEKTNAHALIVEEYPDAKNFDIEYHQDGTSSMTFEVNGKLCQSKVREVVTGQSSGSKTTDIFPADTPIQIDCLR